jgi:UDP-glucose 4-epimerase
MKTNVLITGGSGFIGSHLAEEFATRGASVTILDVNADKSNPNLEWINSSHRVQLVSGDIRDYTLAEHLIKDATYILHHAAIPSVQQSITDPTASHDVNATASVQLLSIARRYPVRRFVFASSSSIYGNNAQNPVPETSIPNPASPYAVQKLATEYYGSVFAQLYGLPFVSLRYFNVFGPRQSASSPYSGVIAQFARAIASDSPSHIFGDGEQTRDFVFIRDVVAANLLSVTAPESSVVGKVFNVGSGKGTSINALYSLLCEQFKRPETLVYNPPRQGEIKASVADISAARQCLGFEPATNFAANLTETCDWYRRHL